MPEAVMTETERAVLDTMIANEQSRELTSAVEEFRSADNEFAASLVRYADNFSTQVRQRVRKTILEHPEGYPAIISLLRTVLEWVEKDRAALRAPQKFSGLRTTPSPDAARKLKDLDHFEKFVRAIARDILKQQCGA